MNPNDEVSRNRLFRAVQSSYRALDPFRKLTHNLVEEYAGSGYGANARNRRESLLNLMNQCVDAYTMSLAANRPRILLSTKHAQLRPFAKHYEIAVNNLLGEIQFEKTVRQWVLDAFFCVGIVKVHMADSGQVMVENDVWMDPGRPFASNVSIDNWVHDTGAKKWSEVQFAGDTFRIAFEDLKRGDMFDQSVVANLQPNSKLCDDHDTLRMISSGNDTDQDELEPMIDLMDIWVPRDGKIYTFPIEKNADLSLKGKPVAVMDWDGPEFGPYHLLGFNDVPENIMPTAPASHLWPLAREINSLMRKQSKRARAAKQVHGYSGAAAPDAERIQKSSDDQFIQINEASQFETVKVGGVDPTAEAYSANLVATFDRAAGNLQALLGLGQQADTLGQEQLIHGAAGNKVSQMQYRVVEGVRSVVRDLGYMLWQDQATTLQGEIPVEGTDIVVPTVWSPEDREGDFFDYNFEVDVYSMPHQTPGQRLQIITNYLDRITPMAQLLMQQGGSIDFKKLTEVYADLSNEHRLTDIVTFTSALPDEQPAPQGGTLPSATKREYVRRSVSNGPSPQGKAHVEQQNWMALAKQSQNQNTAV